MIKPTHALVPAEPTEDMMTAIEEALKAVDRLENVSPTQLKEVFKDFARLSMREALAASPHAGQVSRELRDKAAKASYDENGGNDEYEWEDAPEPQKTWSYQQVDVVFAALGLSVEERTDADNS